MDNQRKLETVRLDDENSTLVILDQTRLPSETVYLHLKKLEEFWHAIRILQVRGAPAIGVAAAAGLYLAAKAVSAADFGAFYAEFQKAKDYLATARPTAVNLFWALDRMERVVLENQDKTVPEIKNRLKSEAEAIRNEDIENCRKIGEYGLELLRPGMGILTHCNAGRLAAVEYGTATAPIYIGQERNYNLKVFADETRPLLQGARLTAFELQQAGVDVTLICDNMASSVMRNGWVQAVFVGCDRVAANGDTANKVGTSGLAVLAKHYNIPFYVCAPAATIDMACAAGRDICIEQRDGGEITHMWYEKPVAPERIAVYNPAFDVTDHTLITAFVTERGVVRPPFDEAFKKLFSANAEG